MGVWQHGDEAEVGRRAAEPSLHGLAREQARRHPRQLEVRFASEHHVGEPRERVVGGRMADLRAAEHQAHLRCDRAQHPDDLLGLDAVPDVDPEADEARPLREQALGDERRRVVDGELADRGAIRQRAHVGEQAAQPERGVAVARVQGGEQDVGCTHRRASWPRVAAFHPRGGCSPGLRAGAARNGRR